MRNAGTSVIVFARCDVDAGSVGVMQFRSDCDSETIRELER